MKPDSCESGFLHVRARIFQRCDALDLFEYRCKIVAVVITAAGSHFGDRKAAFGQQQSGMMDPDVRDVFTDAYTGHCLELS